MSIYFFAAKTAPSRYNRANRDGGLVYENVAIRGKGNTSLTQVEQYGNSRYSFKLEFDHYDNALNYYGLDKLSLNNLIQDNTMLKDYLCYQLMGSFGVDAPLCSFVYITVNGENWGLYLAVEGVEESFLQRNYGSSYGELYKPDSQSMGGGRGNGGAFSLGDWQQEAAGETGGAALTAAGSQDTIPTAPEGMEGGFPGQEGFSPGTEGEMPEGGAPELPEDPEGGGFSMGSDDTALLYTDDAYSSYQNIFDNAKTDVTDSDKDRLIASLQQLNAQENLEEVVDVEEVIRYFVVHNFVCNFDSYTSSMIHNYYLYEEDGQLSMISWDYNLAFGGFLGSSDATALVNYPIDTPVSGGTVDSRPMLAWIFSSEEYTQLYHQYFSQFLAEWFDSGAFAQAFQQVVDLITPYVEKDPTKFCTTEEFQAGVEALEDFCLLRAQSVQGQLEGTIPSTDDGQSADSSSLVDASSVDISAMGTMNNGGGGQRSWERGMGQSQEAVEGAGISAATQDSAGQAPAIPQGQEDMGSPPELPSGEGPQEAPGQTAPDSASSATEESPSSEVESSSGEGDTSNGEESPSSAEEQASPEEAGGAMGQEPPTQPAEGAADTGIEAQPGALGQGQSQASSTTEQWVLLGGSFLALGIGLAATGLYHRKG